MSGLLQLVGYLLVWLIGLGLLLTIAFWAMANIWLLLGILATLIVLLIIYGMATSDNEWVSGLTNLTLVGIVCFVAYAIFA
ncbi:hypothetical protein [Psychrobacter sp. CMS30]|uniref:hypothetical protein n=1 Tax=Psychrobacter sp. CMS30 TaxID=2774126 RepID=UPI0019186782|nr:hypothetical protein [Psychrobacter sp. CMS30]